MSSYPTRQFRRTALAPGILGAIVLLAGLALLNTSAFVWIEFPAAILALIVCVYAWQARQWWWLLPLGAIAVLWNPVLPITLHADKLWLILQYLGAIVFIVAGILIKVPNPEDRNRRSGAPGAQKRR
ncbi:DUF6804 family protein [Galbitalea soli]|uniref:Uncharacterized protein n=1 Tax=Galbitalea soli TaxID=1268042 RepID=A0A7C9TNU9_9MICO|nr:DUF6804 family protein [Galbitalea soli]NEM90397.1 hypothetical protein [Galbitalea soli]NYJ31108.1 hypothetical protein [Galbitalea soli]